MWVCILALIAAICAFASAEEARLRRVFDETCWTEYKGKVVRGGIAPAVKGIESLHRCKTKCMEAEKCVALQWDLRKKACVLHVGRGIPSWKRAKDINQYLKRPCKDKVMTIQLEDLTPGSTKNKVFFFEGFEGHEWYLDVERNTMLFSQQTHFEKRNKDGKVTKQGKVKDDCFYIGTANGGEHEGGLASVSTCEKGKTRVYIQTPIQDYEINPFKEYNARKKRSATMDPLMQLKETFMETVKRNAPGTNKQSAFSLTPSKEDRKEGVVIDLEKQQPIPHGNVLYLDLSSIVDVSFSNAFKSHCPSTDDQMWLHIAQLYNHAQVWFLSPTLGFQIWLSMGKVILMDDPLVRNPDRNRLKQSYGLMNNCNYFKKIHHDSKYWDAVFILTESDFMTDGLGGLAIGSGACHEEYQCAAVKSQEFDLAMLTRAIVHETAHLLGMPDVYPPAEASKFCYTGLMRSAQFAHDWSRCDNQAFEHFLYTKLSKCITRPNARLTSKNVRPNFRSNVAWRYKAKQSSTYNGDEVMWGAWKAVDGSIATLMQPETKADPSLASCQRTNKEDNPWLRVEVMPEYQGNPIDTIHIINRPERCKSMCEGVYTLSNFEVRIGNNADHSKNPLCYERKAAPHLRTEGSMLVVHCSKIMSGKYVSIQIKGTGTLNICELFVFQKIKLPDFKSPYKCEDEQGFCAEAKQRGRCGGDYASTNKKKCPYTCGYCKRKAWTYSPDRSKVKQGGAPRCGDNADYCGKVSSKGKCDLRSSIQLCPKTCGKGCTVKAPEE